LPDVSEHPLELGTIPSILSGAYRTIARGAKKKAAAKRILIMRRRTARVEVMPLLPVVFGLAEVEAAAAIGISASKFRTLVNDKRMPSPRRLDGRNIWDVDELRAAFKNLPHAGEDEKADSWADVV
jgi:predicted DNA-binding transcriptional regulator AlpA